MTSWSELLARAAMEPEFKRRSQNEFSLLYTRGAGGVERGQRVLVRRYEAWGDEMVEIRSAFASAKDMSADSALLHNLDLPIGSIARHGEVLVLLAKLPMASVELEGVLLAARRVSMVADMLEAKHGADRF